MHGLAVLSRPPAGASDHRPGHGAGQTAAADPPQFAQLHPVIAASVNVQLAGPVVIEIPLAGNRGRLINIGSGNFKSVSGSGNSCGGTL